MPSVKDFDKKKKAKKAPSKQESFEIHEAANTGTEKRRPATEAPASPHDEHSADAVYVKTEVEAATKSSSIADDHDQDHDQHHPEAEPNVNSDHKEKIHIDFVGSELLRAKVPKVFEVAEAVAEDWVNDGSFEGLPVGHPLAQLAASVGLKKAKQVENKLREKGVFMMVQMGYEFAKSKIKKS